MSYQILIADDDPENEPVLSRRLVQIGHHPAGVVSDANECYRRVQQSRPDLCLIAMHLHGDMEGLRLATRIQSELHTPCVCFASSPRSTKELDPELTVGVLFRYESDECLAFALEIQRKRFLVEERLRQSEERFRLLGETIHEVFWIIAPDLSRVEYVSPGVQELFGITAEHLTAEPRSWLSVIEPADFPEVRNKVRQGFRSGVASYVLEFRIHMPDGAHRWIMTTAYPARDESGRITNVVGISEDVTNRRNSEMLLSRAQYSIEHASDSIFWLDPGGAFVYANEAACESLGYMRSELIGQKYQLIDPRVSDDMWQLHWRELREKRTMRIEAEHIAKNGRKFPVEVTSNYVDFGGEKYNFAFVRDITARKQADRNLQESRNQALRFSSLAAHEIRNPLTVIRTQLESALRPDISAEILQKVISSVYDDMLRLNHAVEDLLQLSSMQAGTFRLKMELLSVGAFLHEFNREASILARSRNMEVELFAGPEAFAMIDVMRIRQVFFNMLDNALKHSEPGSRIRFGHDVEEGKVCIQFIDQGRGIPAREIREIFTPFYRGSTAPESIGGAGLGLALVKWIVDLHNGAVEVQSAEGLGTTFVIRLPLAGDGDRQKPGAAIAALRRKD